ncbi:hypothetical protein DXM29_09505 [Agrobacterium tumefaciens]|jgi:hypothetical protein|uniref:hypothetical protein n=1 Tax=Agrobacterium tumefaciens TaxID=358 RepID=UPI00122FB4A0|nr:hypothetical protein DXM29_09505 [Agrobacterium tumefaciens]
MAVELAFADSIKDFRQRLAHDKAERALVRTESGKAERAARAAAEGRADYKPRRWFANDATRQLAKQRDKEEQQSVKRATGVRGYTFHETEEARLAARRESNRLASRKRRKNAATATA